MFGRKEQKLRFIERSDQFGLLSIGKQEYPLTKPIVKALYIPGQVKGIIASNLRGVIATDEDPIELYVGTPAREQWHHISVKGQSDTENTQQIGKVTRGNWGNPLWHPIYDGNQFLIIHSMRGNISLTILDPDTEVIAYHGSTPLIISGSKRIPRMPARRFGVVSGSGRVEVNY